MDDSYQSLPGAASIPPSTSSASLSPSITSLKPPQDDGTRWGEIKRTSRISLVIFYASLVVFICLAIWRLVATGAEKHVVANTTAFFAVAIAMPLTLYDINAHLQNYVSPIQRFYIRIMLMVPIYAAESWLALVWKDYSLYWETLRECYEAYVIHSAGNLLLEFLEGQERVSNPGAPSGSFLQARLCREAAASEGSGGSGSGSATASGSGRAHHPAWHTKTLVLNDFLATFLPRTLYYPAGSQQASELDTSLMLQGASPIPSSSSFSFSFFSRSAWGAYARRGWRLEDQFIPNFKSGIFQYVLIRLVLSVVTLALETGGALGEPFSPSSAAPYLTFTLSLSQAIAMYWLVYFYMEMHDALLPLKPFYKLGAIKGVVFVSFWQGVGINLLVSAGWIKPTTDFTQLDVASGLQNYLICWEMAGAAVLHHYTFSRREFKVGGGGGEEGSSEGHSSSSSSSTGSNNSGSGSGSNYGSTSSTSSRQWSGGDGTTLPSSPSLSSHSSHSPHSVSGGGGGGGAGGGGGKGEGMPFLPEGRISGWAAFTKEVMPIDVITEASEHAKESGERVMGGISTGVGAVKGAWVEGVGSVSKVVKGVGQGLAATLGGLGGKGGKKEDKGGEEDGGEGEGGVKPDREGQERQEEEGGK